jgi:uncharacterized Zn finger protein (UPF0148 family)
MAMTHCGKCHTCGLKLVQVLDGEEWCPNCGQYRRYVSHGFSPKAGEYYACEILAHRHSEKQEAPNV